MIHYHGVGFGLQPREYVRLFEGRHVLVTFAHHKLNEATYTILGAAYSFCVDNGAFSIFKSGATPGEWTDFYASSG